ncbi:hypothetical protein CVD09_19495 [Acinetobacter seifertii]|nr:hypothetical protein CVD09_19495 [Acinetobacter seifertii]
MNTENKQLDRVYRKPEIQLFGSYSISPINLILQLVWLTVWLWKLYKDLRFAPTYENPILVYSIGMFFYFLFLCLGIYIIYVISNKLNKLFYMGKTHE